MGETRSAAKTLSIVICNLCLVKIGNHIASNILFNDNQKRYVCTQRSRKLFTNKNTLILIINKEASNFISQKQLTRNTENLLNI